MKKQILIITLLQVLLVMELTAQVEKPVVNDTLNRKGFVLYINQPVGFINKVRLKAGYKTEQNSTYLLSFTNFYSNFPDLLSDTKYTGIQLCFEYQKTLSKNKKAEMLVYYKAGIGDYEYERTEYAPFGKSRREYGTGNYILFGAGIGQELFFNKSKTLFVQFNEGIEFC